MAGKELHLVGDLLDKLVLDRDGREMGRVDGIVLEVGDGAARRVVAIEIGAPVLFRRVSPRLGRVAAGIERALGVDRGGPIRIPFDAILDIDGHIRVDRKADA